MQPLHQSPLINTEVDFNNKLQSAEKTSDTQKIDGTNINKWTSLKKIAFATVGIIQAGIVGYYVNSLRYGSAQPLFESTPYENSKKDFKVIKTHQESVNIPTPHASEMSQSPPASEPIEDFSKPTAPVFQNSSYEGDANSSSHLPIASIMAVGLLVFFRKSLVNHVLKPIYDSSNNYFHKAPERIKNDSRDPTPIKKIKNEFKEKKQPLKNDSRDPTPTKKIKNEFKEKKQPLKKGNQFLNDPYEGLDFSKVNSNKVLEFFDYHFSLVNSPDTNTILLVEERFNDLVKNFPELARKFAIKCLNEKPIESNLIGHRAFTIFINQFNEIYPSLFTNESKGSQRLLNARLSIDAHSISEKCHSILENAFLYLTECKNNPILLLNNLLELNIEDLKKTIDFLHYCDLELAQNFIDIIVETKNNIEINPTNHDKILSFYKCLRGEFGIEEKANRLYVALPSKIIQNTFLITHEEKTRNLVEKRFNDLVKNFPELARIFAIKCLNEEPIENNSIAQRAFTIFINQFNEIYPSLFTNESKGSQRLLNARLSIDAHSISEKCHSILGNAFLYLTECKNNPILLLNNLLELSIEDLKKTIDFLHYYDLELAQNFIDIIVETKNNIELYPTNQDKILSFYECLRGEFGIEEKANQLYVALPS